MQMVLQQTFPLLPLLVDYHRCQKALDAKGVDTTPCDWYKRVYKSLCPMSWVNPSHFLEFDKPLHVDECVYQGSLSFQKSFESPTIEGGTNSFRPNLVTRDSF